MNAAKVRVIGGLVVAILTLVSLPTAAQESRGTISGRVLDTSKAVVPGATVSITNVAMNTTVTMTTNETGFFQAPYLIPGTYRIVAELSGFKRHVRENVPLRIGDTLDLELVLDVGGTTEAVTVTAETTLLETSSASLGQVIDTRRVAELPTPHGDPYALIGLAGGVSYSRDPRLDRPFEPTHIVGFAMDGTRANRSDVTIDGVPMTATANAGEVISSVRAAARPGGRVQGADRHVRCQPRQHGRWRDQSELEVGHESAERDGLFRQDAVGPLRQ